MTVVPDACSACAKPFVGALRIISLPSGRRLHPACLKCSTCSLVIADREFVELEDGKFAHPAVRRTS